MVPEIFRDPGPEWHKRELKSIQDSIPRGVKLDDAMVYKITRYFCAKYLGRFWPLDFDEAGNIRTNGTSVGPGIKIFYAADETWYYPVFYQHYILSGDDELVEYEIVDPGSVDTNSMTAYSLWTFGSIEANRGIVDNIASDTSQKRLVTKSLALQTSSAGLRSAGPVITENSERWLIMDCETRSHIMYCSSPLCEPFTAWFNPVQQPLSSSQNNISEHPSTSESQFAEWVRAKETASAHNIALEDGRNTA